jgi:hypothetical protein
MEVIGNLIQLNKQKCNFYQLFDVDLDDNFESHVCDIHKLKNKIVGVHFTNYYHRSKGILLNKKLVVLQIVNKKYLNTFKTVLHTFKNTLQFVDITYVNNDFVFYIIKDICPKVTIVALNHPPYKFASRSNILKTTKQIEDYIREYKYNCIKYFRIFPSDIRHKIYKYL